MALQPRAAQARVKVAAGEMGCGNPAGLL
ncbi:hypothetical protein XOCgx_4266 [Xanthomonas oryzae pv. oryzicola]|nr:hypothetical protein XOCgx_4266 [Xanthomonas oryzae pv. oryzicola]